MKRKISLKNLFEPTPKRLLQLAWAIKLFCGAIGSAAWLQDRPTLGFCILAIGAAADVVLSLFKEGQA